MLLLQSMESQHRNNDKDMSFWTKYKHFASNEILLYAIMVLGILFGILIISLFI